MRHCKAARLSCHLARLLGMMCTCSLTGSVGCGAGTTKVYRLEENIRAFDVKLTKQDMDKLEAIFHADKISGQRYAEAGMKQALHGGEQ